MLGVCSVHRGSRLHFCLPDCNSTTNLFGPQTSPRYLALTGAPDIWPPDVQLSSQLQIQGVSEKRYFCDFCLVSVLELPVEARFYFFTCDLESEYQARFIPPPGTYPLRTLSALEKLKMPLQT